jgi:membrane glycosyltransferase
MTWIDFVGYLAALTVLATFCMDTIVPLRGLAIASNVLFILYGIRRTPLSCVFSSRCSASGQHREDRPA